MKLSEILKTLYSKSEFKSRKDLANAINKKNKTAIKKGTAKAVNEKFIDDVLTNKLSTVGKTELLLDFLTSDISDVEFVKALELIRAAKEG